MFPGQTGGFSNDTAAPQMSICHYVLAPISEFSLDFFSV